MHAVSAVSLYHTQNLLALCDAHVVQVDRTASKEEGTVALFKARGADVCGAQYKTESSEWSYPDCDGIAAREAAVDDLWQQLTAAVGGKREYLRDSLARNEFAAKVAQKVDQHASLHRRLVAWVATKLQALREQAAVSSVADAAVKLRLLEALEADVKNMRQETVPSLQTLGAEVCASAFESALSTWRFADSASVGAREMEVSSRLDELDDAAAKKREQLLKNRGAEEKKEELRQQFAHAANAMRSFVKDNIIFVKVFCFCFCLFVCLFVCFN